MKRIKKKLHSQSGASFLFALLAFLVAAMVSVTIVAPATALVFVFHRRAFFLHKVVFAQAARLQAAL